MLQSKLGVTKRYQYASTKAGCRKKGTSMLQPKLNARKRYQYATAGALAMKYQYALWALSAEDCGYPEPQRSFIIDFAHFLKDILKFGNTFLGQFVPRGVR